MRVVYLTSRYPSLSETFITREMQSLSDLGHKIVICQLKWTRLYFREQGLLVSHAYALLSQFGLLHWTRGLIWAIRMRPVELRLVWQDFRQAHGGLDSRLKILVILLTTLRLAQCLADQEVDHIRAHFLHTEALSAMWLALFLHVPYSVTVHTLVVIFPRTLVEKVVQRASFCVAITRETMELIRALRGTEDRVYLIRNGINLEEMIVGVPTVAEKSINPLLIAVGRLVEKKGFDTLIEACYILRDWGVKYTCEIIGDGPEHHSLNRLIDKLGLNTHVLLVGALPFSSVKHCYRSASIVIVPSRNTANNRDRDGLPTVIIEALTMGIPVIASEVAGIPDIVTHNKTGLLVPPDNPKELAKAIFQLLQNDEMRSRLAYAGFKKVRREFDLTRSVHQLEGLIHESIQAKG